MIMKRIILFLIALLPVLLSAETYDPSRFEREVLVSSSRDAIQFEVFAQ